MAACAACHTQGRRAGALHAAGCTALAAAAAAAAACNRLPGTSKPSLAPWPLPPQALDVVLKHRMSYNEECLAVGRGFFFRDAQVGWRGRCK